MSPRFSDVALPVPLDSLFTYSLSENLPVPEIGARVLVPFRNERKVGVVTAVHDKPPSVRTKAILSVLDSEPIVSETLMRLAQWISHYYLAPLGEVFRSMLPLTAELKRAKVYTITDLGREALYNSATSGSSLRSHKAPEDQLKELQVLDYLADRDSAEESALRRLAGVTRPLLAGLLQKKWVTCEDLSSAREAGKFERIAALKAIPSGKLTPQQRAIVAALEKLGGRLKVDSFEMHGLSLNALRTLAKHGSIEIVRIPKTLAPSALRPKGIAPVALTAEQSAARDKVLSAIARNQFHVALLHGVTGSGKTAVYLAAMQAVLATGKSAVLLVPEIGLTPAAAANLYELFGADIAILHSALSAHERAQEWRRIHTGEARIVVGTRSAVFAPVKDLALLVVDEEHDASYKQEETPRYHGRDVAVIRGKLESATVVLASATPSLESYHNAAQGKYELIELRERVERRPLPEVEIIDMRQEFQETGEEQLFSRALSAEIRARLVRGEQAMVLLNRRGYSTVVLCRSCGETLQCKNCAIALTHHKRSNVLECHCCGYRAPVPKLCPKCGSEHVFFLGTGSEKLEERLSAEFPRARIGRLDRDTVRTRHDFERVLAAFDAGDLDLVVGTQMIAKGHDIHGVTLVGVVGADFALGFPDFRAAERTFQLLTQVGGRAGRGDAPGRVILQTYFPEHYAIQFAAQHDYAGFCEKELRYRRWMNYPPFSAVANVLVRSEKLDEALRFSALLGKWLEENKSKGLRVMGPAAAPIVRLKRDYRYHFVLKAESRERLNQTLRSMLAHAAEKKIPRTQLIVDVDALSLL